MNKISVLLYLATYRIQRQPNVGYQPSRRAATVVQGRFNRDARFWHNRK
ncbi:hypothetical protein N9N41_04365 [Opitutales bacterium]|nr:hypothetical protein [Opitutales bacterium]